MYVAWRSDDLSHRRPAINRLTDYSIPVDSTHVPSYRKYPLRRNLWFVCRIITKDCNEVIIYPHYSYCTLTSMVHFPSAQSTKRWEASQSLKGANNPKLSRSL